MAPILVIRHLTCTDKAAQQKVIAALQKVIAYARSSEPEVTKNAVAIPREGQPGHDTYVITIEEYANEAVQKAYDDSAAVAELQGVLRSLPSLFAKKLEVYQFSPSASYTRPEIKNVKNPIIISAHFGYQPGKSTPALAGWDPLVTYAREKEPGTLSYAVLDDAEKSFIRTVEVYENQEVIDSHLKGPLIAENQAQNGEWRTGERFVFRCTLEGGYFLK